MSVPQWSYNLTKPYPWKHSLLVAVLFALLTVLLVFVNIPLSAYTIQQSFGYNPNDTEAAPYGPHYASLVPSLLRRKPGDFVQHTFTIGDTYQTNFSSFTGRYTIYSAYNRTDTPGSSVPQVGSALPNFAYSNNDLRACDVLQVTLTMTFGQSWSAGITQATATVSCWYPYFFVSVVDLTYVLFDVWQGNRMSDPLLMMHVVGGMLLDLNRIVLTMNSVTVQLEKQLLSNYTGSLTVTFEQCCATCNDSTYVAGTPNGPETPIETYETASPDTLSFSTLLHDHPSCDDQEVKFKSSVLYFQSGYSQDYLQSIDSFGIGTNLPTALNNTLRAIYHATRLDLGVIRPNQIYNSSARFNASIANLTFPTGNASAVSSMFAARATIGDVDLSNATYNIHVPNILYLTPAFKLRPMPQAIAAVFVSTFTMLRAIWSAFNFVTSILVTRTARKVPDAESKLSPDDSISEVDVNLRQPIGRPKEVNYSVVSNT